ncbi:MAG: DUF4190 domain-containing protein [Peptococcaceae bacterium]|nr:DUF4190 domain-containing protein [Peptococcaceae bacterium]
MGNATLFFQRNPMQFLLTSHLNCLVDNAIRYQIPPNKPIEIELAPGLHMVQMSFSYMGNECGMASVQAIIEPGKQYQMIYRPPLVVYQGGTISIYVVGGDPQMHDVHDANLFQANPIQHIEYKRSQKGLAMASLILGIISCLLPCIGVITAIVGLSLGFTSLAQQKGGTGMAWAGMILGTLGMIISAVVPFLVWFL